MFAHARQPDQASPQGPITLADGAVIAFPKLTHSRAGLAHAQWRDLSPVEKIERQLGLNLTQTAEIISGPWEECDRAEMAIKARVLCVFWAIGTKMIRAWADGTLDLAAACERARQPAFDDDFAWFAERNRGPAPN